MPLALELVVLVFAGLILRSPRIFLPLLAAGPVLLCGSLGCHREDLGFPAGFLFGTATASFQVDMGCPTLPASSCTDPNSDWYQFTTSAETIGDQSTHLSGQDPAVVGPGHWELYQNDLDLAADQLFNNAFRMSVEWSRIFLAPTDGLQGFDALQAAANHEALEHYHAVFAALAERGLAPLITLNHYTLPSWIHDGVGCHRDLGSCSPKGWLDKDRTVSEFAKYAGFVAKEFAAEVDLWATLNEPFAVVLPGYLWPSEDRTNPPSVALKTAEAKLVLEALIEAHARAYDAVVANDTEDADGDGDAAMIGVVYAMSPVRPKDPANPLDVQAAENIFYLWNLAYLNAVVLGEFDAELNRHATKREDLTGRMDYLGVNYYTRITVEGMESPVFPELSELTTFNPLNIQPWENYPKGIYEMVMLVKEAFDLPILVTENGIDDTDPDAKEGFLVRNLSWLSAALRDGADLRGYFYWSLLDNYEWNHGMDLQFGLYQVDQNDPQKIRSPRPVAAIYAEIAASSQIPPHLAKRFPIEDQNR